MCSRLRTSPDKLFEVFAEIAKPQEEGQDPFILQVYPPDYTNKDVLNSIPKFAFPCKNNTTQVDQFTFVLTDLNSTFRFGYCRHGSGAQTCLCVVSYLPWFEVFYKMLNFLAEIINRSDSNALVPFLKAAYGYRVPMPDEPVTIVAAQEMFNFTAPDPTLLPCIPASRNLTEYYNAIDTGNMMRIFASMLHERRIIITSKKLSRVTACIHASEALLYPMHWQHLFIPVLPAHLLDYISAPMPYLIGVHTSLMERIMGNKMELGDAVIVDADKNEVITEHEDLEALPEDVSSYLKRHLKTEKVKISMMETGDAISKAFLQALVRLIGGYREALKFSPDAPITFERELFIQSRSSQSMQAFLENMLQLQIFQQFINGRLELLNNGEGFHDLFEMESIKYADRLGTQSKYKEWLSKQGRKIKAGGKDIFSDMKEKVKTHGKKAMSKFREINENKMSSQKVGYSKGVTYSKSQGHAQRPSTIAVGHLTSSRPPRPPPPSFGTNRPHTFHKGETSKVYNTLTDDDHSSHDDSQLRLSYHRMSMDLMHDIDIRNAMMRSASAEVLPRVQETTTPLSTSDGDISSSPSSEALSPSDENISGIPYVDMHGSSAHEASPFAAESSSDEDHGQRTKTETGRPVVVDRLIITKSQRGPVAPPRSGRKGTSPSSSPQLARPPVPAPRRASMERPATGVGVGQSATHLSRPPKPAIQEKPLIRFESSESETDPMDMFDPLRSRAKAGGSRVNTASAAQPAPSVGSQPLASPGDEESADGRGSPGLSRNTSTRNSLMRAPAFRRPDADSPVRSSYRDDVSPEKEAGPKDEVADLFDPLANVSNSSVSGNPSGATTKSEVGSPESLMHDWTIDHLAGTSGYSRVHSGGTLTCPSLTTLSAGGPPASQAPPVFPTSRPTYPPSAPTRSPRPHTVVNSSAVDSQAELRSGQTSSAHKFDALDSLMSLGSRQGPSNSPSHANSLSANVNTQNSPASRFSQPRPAARNAKPRWETFD